MTRLDAVVLAELGDQYSHLAWPSEAFLSGRPCKWQLSHGAFAEERLIGFWIASCAGHDAHTHRVAVGPDARGVGAGRALFDAVRRAAQSLACRRITLTLVASNQNARAFYEVLGFAQMRGVELDRFARERGRPGPDRDDIIDDSHRYAAYAYELKP